MGPTWTCQHLIGFFMKWLGGNERKCPPQLNRSPQYLLNDLYMPSIIVILMTSQILVIYLCISTIFTKRSVYAFHHRHSHDITDISYISVHDIVMINLCLFEWLFLENKRHQAVSESAILFTGEHGWQNRSWTSKFRRTGKIWASQNLRLSHNFCFGIKFFLIF